MGILNVTPDSFSDGGRYMDVSQALQRAEKMQAEGAEIIDVGGYSSRPGAAHIPAGEELDRVAPVVQAIRAQLPTAIISVDTFRSEVAGPLLEMGAHILNDISAGLLDPEMMPLAARHGAPYLMMHMRGTPQTMQQNLHYDNVVAEVWQFLCERVQAARAAGLRDILIDPGIGFGKSMADNYRLLAQTNFFCNMQLPVVIGISRKSMMYKLFGTTPGDVPEVAAALHLQALLKGAGILRVHDVRDAVRIREMYLFMKSHEAV